MADWSSAGGASLPSRALRALRRLGIPGFVRLAFDNFKLLVSGRYREHGDVYDRSFDRKHGVDTAGTVAVEELDAPDDLKRRARRYEATDPDFFIFLIESAGLTRREEYLFIDLGSGKGRGLLLAALAGFRRVVGVEMEPELNGIARRNIEIFSPQYPTTEFTAVNGDATAFAFPPVPTVLFLNNPFDAYILERVLTNLERVHTAPDSDVLLLYMHSNHEDRVRQRDGWEELDAGNFQSRRQFYAIFRWRGGKVQS